MISNKDLNTFLVRNTAVNTELELFAKKLNALVGETLTEEMVMNLIYDTLSMRSTLLHTNKILIEQVPVSTEEEKQKLLQVMDGCLENVLIEMKKNNKENSYDAVHVSLEEINKGNSR